MRKERVVQPEIIFKYFLTVGTDNPVRLAISFLATPSPIICTRSARVHSEGVQKGLRNHPDFIPKTSRLGSLTNHVQKEFFSESFNTAMCSQSPEETILR